ncbi:MULTISPECIES: RelA/SpoT family protein [Halobacteriovorax]|uniref:Bifunctional (P)ppGpp synthetase/guanosine-3',5'-bis(Diphosphate) 3'-pyrophosphohydrolase n=1 Tax=Halobacteriovorax vibrionivorans TaxID=2152716 RepID=A0ABY0IIU1_9BACT|nr:MULTISPECIES: bifunctional (p)ppGpp synthetase/guanosine-3',5'-bis(diphosphate) 3'-pyrophosphohydrolase [Halobacteriovorax]AYF43388.1 putative GTP diphosphokinase [Halobacteriovorax sp. BALOs_7]RZF22038.1 bifunctional (p)ppGpp synthetase/guanosine-3',5'-bis(diphosphate) 3'-pyrophosphohydrolase [Halobacteriovorax vibrionivorans]TGD47098.1 bifunctional (p)ppGpp synthetase/guanosine-3',5'-bis(diphosphate) 3'-pyrophosphohydrolase [Halobacteriovorax sp. Y22]
MYQQLDFTHERELNIDELCRRVEAYYPDANFTLLRKAYLFAEKSHEGQMRSSGEKYIIHPLNVAATLVKLHMDLDTIIAGLLHDVVEDCNVTPEEIEKEFTTEIAQIVVGLTKISKMKFKSKEQSQAENFRKMVVAMAQDLRVIIVKLADRMHNMKTLQYVREEKQKRIAEETLDIYVPLASRLGINSVKIELEDICLRYLHPDVYYRLAEKVAMKKSERENYIGETIGVVTEKLFEYSVRADITGRSKHFYSIYKKMVSRGVDFEQIHDILAFRIIVNNITECYKALGIIHSAFTPIPGRFKDYIAIPKVNNYQSLHTTVVGPKAERIEIQIRTQEMHEVAERGIAAHWKYKEGVSSGKTKLDWVQELLEYNKDTDNSSEFMSHVKNDLDVGGVFVFTPNGDVFELQDNATPLDFAYRVHTDIGNRCVGAKVNGRMVPLKYSLRSGDTIEILTSKTQTPNKDWLNIVRSSKAKAKIKSYLLKAERERNIEVGKETLDKAFKVLGTSLKAVLKRNELDNAKEKLSNIKTFSEIYNNVGAGKLHVDKVIECIPGLKDDHDKDETKKKEIDTLSTTISKTAKRRAHKDNAVIVDGLDDLMVRMARCCNPIPGDPIIGYITRGRGITIHRSDCTRYDVGDVGRQIAVEWNENFSFKHPVNIRVLTHDRPGILSMISKELGNLGVNIRSAVARSTQDRKGSLVFEIEVKDYSELLKTISGLEALDAVISVTRG